MTRRFMITHIINCFKLEITPCGTYIHFKFRSLWWLSTSKQSKKAWCSGYKGMSAIEWHNGLTSAQVCEQDLVPIHKMRLDYTQLYGIRRMGEMSNYTNNIPKEREEFICKNKACQQAIVASWKYCLFSSCFPASYIWSLLDSVFYY